MMNIMKSPTSTPDLVAAVSRELTPTERRIAREVLDEPTLLAFGTVSDLASRVGTSRPTIVRFANKLARASQRADQARQKSSFAGKSGSQ